MRAQNDLCKLLSGHGTKQTASVMWKQEEMVVSN